MLKHTPPYMSISVKLKNSHDAYNDHSNKIANQPTVWEIRDEILLSSATMKIHVIIIHLSFAK